jgi:DNA repair protein SbcD/Mre11
MEDATRIAQTSAGGTSVELDTAPRAVVATVPQASRTARKSAQAIRIVATGDNLLSAALPDLTPERRQQRRQRLRAAFRAAVDCALERSAHLFVIAGNLFASPAPENQDRAFVAQELARLHEAGVACVAVAGPRDMGSGAGNDAPYHLYESGAELRFFPQSDVLQPALVVIDGVRVALAGLSAAPRASADPLEKLRIDDPDDVLGRADLAILVLRTPLEALSEQRSSLATLPAEFRLLIAGGASQFGKGNGGKRDAVAPGPSERHSFDTPTNSAGFAWIEMNAEGVTLAEHMRIEEQPRVEVEITTARLFPHGAETDDEDEENYARSGVHLLPVLTPEELMAADLDGDDAVAPYTPPPPDAERERIFKSMLAALKGACQPDTMTRVRLMGPLTRRQFHHLPLAEMARYGRSEAFSLELDTSGLMVEPAQQEAASGLLSLNAEIDRLVEEYRTRLGEKEHAASADIDVAAGLLRARLQTTTGADREAAQ